MPAGSLVLMTRWLYSLLLRIAWPFAAMAFLWRGWRSPAYRGSLRERMGWSLQPRADRPLWLHAASVGEVRALAVLVRALHDRHLPLLVTVGTPTGLARARELFADLAVRAGAAAATFPVHAAPWDFPGAAGRFLRAVRPRAAVFIETELWPNLIAAIAQQEVPLALVSARLSELSLRRYQRFAPRMMRDAVEAFGVITAQSSVDRERFIALGADAARVVVGGNLKFDLQLPAAIEAASGRLRARCEGRPLWVAGSTHPGEEAACIEAHRILLAGARAAGGPMPLLVLAPRRPERFAAVSAWLGTTGLKSSRVSEDAGAGTEVLLLDVMGGLLDWYAAADAVFVGGTLVPVGGHNLLEPAALGKPVISGPHCFNSPESAELLQAANALALVRNADELGQVLRELLEDGVKARAAGARAAAVVAANRGAAARSLAAIDALLSRGATAQV
jgi:3-deoxy-D-manno-octulosonic-acid transferase